MSAPRHPDDDGTSSQGSAAGSEPPAAPSDVDPGETTVIKRPTSFEEAIADFDAERTDPSLPPVSPTEPKTEVAQPPQSGVTAGPKQRESAPATRDERGAAVVAVGASSDDGDDTELWSGAELGDEDTTADVLPAAASADDAPGDVSPTGAQGDVDEAVPGGRHRDDAPTAIYSVLPPPPPAEPPRLARTEQPSGAGVEPPRPSSAGEGRPPPPGPFQGPPQPQTAAPGAAPPPGWQPGAQSAPSRQAGGQPSPSWQSSGQPPRQSWHGEQPPPGWRREQPPGPAWPGQPPPGSQGQNLEPGRQWQPGQPPPGSQGQNLQPGRQWQPGQLPPMPPPGFAGQPGAMVSPPGSGWPGTSAQPQPANWRPDPSRPYPPPGPSPSPPGQQPGWAAPAAAGSAAAIAGYQASGATGPAQQDPHAAPEVEAADDGASRRALLIGTSVAVVAAVGGFVWYRVTDPARDEAPIPYAPTSGSSAAPIAAVADIPEGGGIVLENQAIVLTRPAAQDVRAFSAICTHQACLVSTVGNGRINCPCHGSSFDMTTGAPLAGPAQAPLAAIQVRIENGGVIPG